MEENQVDPNALNFIPCICFVRRGVAKENPDKITLTKEELARVIDDTKRELSDSDADDDDAAEDGANENDQEMDTSEGAAANPANPDDEYNFDSYDTENSTQVAAVGDIAVVDENEPDHVSDGEDSEAEDDKIKATDNLVLVGHVDDDAASLEIYVYNEDEGSMYVHHDFLLPSFPLCIEWIGYDPESDKPGNLCATGCMDPVITIWDLDIQDTLEPALKLGTKASRKKRIPQYGHTDAVLDLSWNTNYTHILASASADQTVLLWDLDEAKAHTTITAFSDKIQTLKFHASDAQMLLTGSCDGTVKLFDCRDSNTVDNDFKLWSFADCEIERVQWDPFNSNHFFTSTNAGKIHYCDVRQEGVSIWSLDAHNEEVSGIIVNQSHRGMMSTTSTDGSIKVWKYDGNGAQLVYEDDVGIGRIQCADVCFENGFTLVAGGDNKRKQLRVIDVREYDTVKNVFGLQ